MYASVESWRAMAAWPLAMRYVVPARHQFAMAGLLVEAWPVEHSVLAPAVGYRVTAGSSRIFYVPDVAHLPDPVAALRDVDLYVGDGATLDRPLIRRGGSVRIGHAAIGTQLEWCAAAGFAVSDLDLGRELTVSRLADLDTVFAGRRLHHEMAFIAADPPLAVDRVTSVR